MIASFPGCVSLTPGPSGPVLNLDERTFADKNGIISGRVERDSSELPFLIFKVMCTCL